MIAYVTVGADDLAAARRFYDALLLPLGYGVTTGPEGLSYALAVPDGAPPEPDLYVKPPFDGRAASAGNGAMVAFEARGRAQVRSLHAAGLAAGGSDEGAPGVRAAYSAGFYVAYLRDPQGNKVAIFADDAVEARRDEAG